MAADPYAACPCGSGKKLKFCCGPHWPEIERIERMYDAQQDVSALDAIEKLEAKLPNHPHLMNLKVDLLFAQGRREEADASQAAFFAAHPENPNARFRHAAMFVEEGDTAQGLRLWYETFANNENSITNTGMVAARAVVTGALMAGEFTAGRTLLNILTALNPQEESLRSTAVQLMSADGQPPLCRELPPIRQAPTDPRWTAEFKEALAPTERANFPRAAALFTALSEKAPQEPAVWANLAALRAMLADLQGASEAYAGLATCNLPWDDAVEAQALAAIYRQDAAGDVIEVLRASFELQDIDRVLELLSADNRCVRVPDAMLVPDDDGSPPPRAAFRLLDRPQVTENATLDFADVPTVVADYSIFGRETDRPPRLIIEIEGQAALDLAAATLREITQEPLPVWGEREIIGSILAEQQAMAWKPHLPFDTPVDRIYDLMVAQQRQAIHEIWPNTPNLALDGKTPRGVMGDPAWRRRLAAAILLQELAQQQMLPREEFDRLRTELGLEPSATIDPTADGTDETANAIPVMRLSRVDASKYSDEALVKEIERAGAYAAAAAVLHLGTEALRRPSIAGQSRMRVLLLLAKMSSDSRTTLQHVLEIQRLAAQEKSSPAPFLIMELRVRLTRREPDEIQRLLRTLMTKHVREPGVAQALGVILQELGLIGPDGRPVNPQQSEPALVLPGSGEESGKLWTPESAATGATKGSLWMPGME